MKTSITNLFAAGTMMAGWAWTQPASAGDYRVHEWGTFTTVGGSDGGLLPGLEVEEEPLPGFVLSLAGFAPADKPKFIALVHLREPKTSPWGSETAAPLFFDIARELFVYYNIAPTQ